MASACIKALLLAAVVIPLVVAALLSVIRADISTATGVLVLVLVLVVVAASAHG